MGREKVSVNLYNKANKQLRLSILIGGKLNDIYSNMNCLEFDCENNFTQHRISNERTLEQLFSYLDAEKYQNYINSHLDLKNFYNAQKKRFQQLKQISYEQC